ncbi:related to solute carrier family 25 member 39 [Cephalotrichum gorgonifer]|uniref:Related to solute carrier family 25 member 39 n=1 Tax=Cephalotrichum gorgonifer TaxID=2041049 RepID=A0AAE8MZV2_9PEZI|nr:related to solute carrier family 25 member 39 [Cephalotrichum gorgonifer]
MTSLLGAANTSQGHDTFPVDDLVASKMSGVSANQTLSSGGGEGEITVGQKMISATSGSLLTALLVTPLDVVRVRLQSQPIVIQPPKIDFSKLALTTNTLSAGGPANLGVTACCREVFFSAHSVEYCLVAPKPVATPSAGAAVGPAVECAVEEAQKRTISSTLDGLKKISRNEGITTLWRGLSPTLLMAIPANIIYFTGYDWLRYNPGSPIARSVEDNYVPLVAGATARMLAAASVNPIELFKTRLQATSGASASGHVLETFRGMQDMVAAQGYRALWKGVTLTLWRDAPFSGIYWWGYETIRGKLTDLRDTRRGRATDRTAGPRSQSRKRSQSQENHRDTFIDSFIAGATSGAAASILTMPFDVGKTRTQVYRDGTATAAELVKRTTVPPEERSMVRLLWHIFQNEGIAGLWKGWIPRTLKVAPACAIMISSYEVSKRVFRGVNEERAHEREVSS